MQSCPWCHQGMVLGAAEAQAESSATLDWSNMPPGACMHQQNTQARQHAAPEVWLLRTLSHARPMHAMHCNSKAPTTKLVKLLAGSPRFAS